MMTADVGEATLPAVATVAKARSMQIVPESALARCKAAFEFVVAASGEKDQLKRPHMSQLFLELGLLKEAENAAGLDHIFHEMDTERRGTVGFRELLIFLSYNGELARRIELAQTLSPWLAQRTDTNTAGGSPSPTHSLSHSPPSTPETGSLADLNSSLKRNTSTTPEDDPLAVKMEAAVRRVRDEWESKEREKEDIMVMALAENQGQRDSNRRLSSLDTQREGSSLVDRNDSAPDAPPSEDRLEDRAEALLARAKAKEEEEVRAKHQLAQSVLQRRSVDELNQQNKRWNKAALSKLFSKSLTAPNLTTLVRGASLDSLKPSGLFKKRASADRRNQRDATDSTTLGGYAPSLLVLASVTAAAAAAALLLGRSKLRA